jgi:hypothetical protein
VRDDSAKGRPLGGGWGGGDPYDADASAGPLEEETAGGGSRSSDRKFVSSH